MTIKFLKACCAQVTVFDCGQDSCSCCVLGVTTGGCRYSILLQPLTRRAFYRGSLHSLCMPHLHNSGPLRLQAQHYECARILLLFYTQSLNERKSIFTENSDPKFFNLKMKTNGNLANDALIFAFACTYKCILLNLCSNFHENFLIIFKTI